MFETEQQSEQKWIFYSWPELNQFLSGWNVIVTTQMEIHNQNYLDEMQKKKKNPNCLNFLYIKQNSNLQDLFLVM